MMPQLLTPALSSINVVLWRGNLKSAPPPGPRTWHATARVWLTGSTYPPGNGCTCTPSSHPTFELLNSCNLCDVLYKLVCQFCVLVHRWGLPHSSRNVCLSNNTCWREWSKLHIMDIPNNTGLYKYVVSCMATMDTNHTKHWWSASYN